MKKLWSSFKKVLLMVCPPVLVKFWLSLKRSDESLWVDSKELTRIKMLPRYINGITLLKERKFMFSDGSSFLSIYNELFCKEIYKFDTEVKQPYIIDAGANIGLGIIYFKSIFPNCKIVAFEPDEEIYKILEKNIISFGLNNVTLRKTGLWDKKEILSFNVEGADAGRVMPMKGASNVITINTERLSEYLDQKVDFLKIDIEGAEYKVLKECSSKLKNVERIFVEYHSFENNEQMLPELLMILKEAGFHLNMNLPGLVSKNPFKKIETYLGMDLQLNIYGIR